MNRHTLAAALLALAGSAVLYSQTPAPQAQPAQGQQPPPNRPIFRTAVDYVEVDARVLDETGKLVRDLKREDFVVLEDGKEQKIDNFSVISLPEVSAETTAFTRNAIDPDVVSSTVARETEGRLFVILLDDRQVAPSRTRQTVNIARKFIEQYVGPRDLTAVVSSSGRTDTSQTFTASKHLLLRAVENFIGRKPQSWTLMTAIAGPDTPLEAERAERYYEAAASMQSIQSVSNWLGSVRGRSKNLVLISEGLDYNYEDVVADPWAELILAQQRDAIAAATRANVTVYPIDPRGLGQDDTIAVGDNDTGMYLQNGVPTPIPADGIPVGLEEQRMPSRSTTMRAEVERAHMALRLIADDTGGFVALNTNDFDKWFKQIVTQSSGYYLLGYTPTNNRHEGKNRSIRVQVKRPGLRVISRKGYIEAFDKRKEAGPLPALIASSPEVREILNGAWPVGDLPLTATAVAFRGPNSTASVAVIVESPSTNLSLTEDNGKLTGTVEVTTAAVDQQNKINNGETQKITFGLTPELNERFKQRGFRTISRLSDLNPGRYQVRIAMVPENSAARGSLWYDLEVPDFSKGDLTLSGVLLSSVAEGRTPTGNPNKLFVDVLTLPPTTVRTFKMSDELNVYAEVYDNQLSPPHQVDVTITVKGEDDRIAYRSNDWASSEELNIGKGAYPSTTWIPIQELGQPGNYVLIFQAQRALEDSKPITRMVPFKVVP